MLEGQCRCGAVSYRLDPPYEFAPLETCPSVHLALAPGGRFRLVLGESMVASRGVWQLCRQCGTTLFYLPGDGRRFCLSSSLERRELLPGALHNAAAGGYRQAGRALEFLQRGFPVDGEIDGETPLAWAARSGSTDTCRLLLEHGADPRRAIGASAIRGPAAEHLQQLLLDSGCDPQELLSEVTARSTTEAALRILEAGADVNRPNSFGQLPLYLACNNSVAMIRLLLESGADPALGNRDGTHPVHYCAGAGFRRRLQVLLDGGAPVNLLELDSQQSALYAACAEGRLECAKLLLDGGADPNLGCKEITPLMAASRYGSLALVDLLLSRGADAGRVSDRGLTAKDMASWHLPDLLAKATEIVLRRGKGRIHYRWDTEAGERCLKLRYRNDVYRWADCHAEIVNRLP